MLPIIQGAKLTGYEYSAGAGGIFTWGDAANGQTGQGTTVDVCSPVQVGALTNWTTCDSRTGSCYAINSDGKLYSWGVNTKGQLGHGNTTAISSPIQVGDLTTWANVSAMNKGFFATKTDGTLWACGYNSRGQLCQGDTTDQCSPVQVGELTTWVKIGSNYEKHFSGVTSDGKLWVAGYNYASKLMTGNATNYSSPVQVGALTDWNGQLTGGFSHTTMLKADGTVWSCGSGANGRLGDGTTTARSSPAQIGDLTIWTHITSGNGDSGGITSDGKAWSWGYQDEGEHGTGVAGTDYSSPTQLGALTNWQSNSKDGNVSTWTNTDHKFYVAGRASSGRLGNGTSTPNLSSPVQIGLDVTWKTYDYLNRTLGGSGMTMAIKGVG